MKSLPVLVLLLVLLPGASPDASACDCIRLQPLSAAVRKEAPFIFEGKVVEIVERSLHTLRTTSGGGSSETKPMGREVVFEVIRSWNGVTTRRLDVSAEVSDCMYPFAIDTHVRRICLEGRERRSGRQHMHADHGVEQGRRGDRRTGPGDGAQVAIIPWCGEMAEWSMAVVLKTTEPETVPGVRIPLSPPDFVDLRGFAPQTPRHAHSQARSLPARTTTCPP